MLIYLNGGTELPGHNEWSNQSKRMHAQPSDVKEQTENLWSYTSYIFILFCLLKWCYYWVLILRISVLGIKSIALEKNPSNDTYWFYSNLFSEI
jgi:hypothetical protein